MLVRTIGYNGQTDGYDVTISCRECKKRCCRKSFIAWVPIRWVITEEQLLQECIDEQSRWEGKCSGV